MTALTRTAAYDRYIRMQTRPKELQMPAHRRARTAVAPLALALALALTGCSAAEDAVNQATDGAKQQAGDAVKNAAAEVARTQLCNLVKDGQVSQQDVEQLKALVSTAEQAGVPRTCWTRRTA